MYDKYNKDIDINQGQEILSDIDPKGKERPWHENKLKTLLLADSYKRIGVNKSYRLIECGTYLEFKKTIDGTGKKLFKANFCKVRLCPMCSWRRSKKIYGQVSKVMDKVLEDKEYRFLFITLTCRNIVGLMLSETLDKLFKSFDRLFKRIKVKKAVKGWFRALEITHNIDKSSKDYDTYHPHFHIILMVNKSYFNKPELYISQDAWTNLWKESLQVDYVPIVDVRTFKTTTKQQTLKSVAESAKYIVKDNDYILPNDKKKTDSAVMIFDEALANRRLVAFGGELKKIHKQLNLDDAEKGDLVANGEEEKIREDLSFIIERYQWHVGYRQYYKA
jgi:plasmid rolling circle replication initiator protein Rep